MAEPMGDDAIAGRLRADLHARVGAHVQPTFRHDGDPDPHPDEAALVSRLTDDVVLPYELKLRELRAENERLRAESNGAASCIRRLAKDSLDALTEKDAATTRAEQAEGEVERLRAERDQDTRAIIDIVNGIERRSIGNYSPADMLRDHFGNRDRRLAPRQPEGGDHG